MFTRAYFAGRFYAPRYFPGVGADPVTGTIITLTLLGVGR